MDNYLTIKQKLAGLKHQLITDFQIKEIGIFGSYIRNEQNENSDLDVLIDFTQYPGMFKFVRLENYLTQQLGVKVDLVLRTALKPKIGKHILSEVVMI